MITSKIEHLNVPEQLTGVSASNMLQKRLYLTCNIRVSFSKIDRVSVLQPKIPLHLMVVSRL